MKRYYELTKEELTKLTEEDLQKLIDIEIAYAGIIPVDVPPAEPSFPSIAIKQTEIGYKVHGIHFKTHDEAVRFLTDFAVFDTDYDSATGYEFKWLKPRTYDCSITTEQFYQKEDVLAHSKAISKYTEDKKAYDSICKEYRKYNEKVSNIVSDVTAAYDEAMKEEQLICRAVLLYQKYLTLTEQDAKIAKALLIDAYSKQVGDTTMHRILCRIGEDSPVEVLTK